jgi:hypothetical protein
MKNVIVFKPVPKGGLPSHYWRQSRCLPYLRKFIRAKETSVEAYGFAMGPTGTGLTLAVFNKKIFYTLTPPSRWAK